MGNMLFRPRAGSVISYKLRFFLAAFIVCLWGLMVPHPVLGAEFSPGDLTFSTLNQSIWGAFANPTIEDKHEKNEWLWDKLDSAGDIVTLDTYIFGEVDFGGEINAYTEGAIGVGFHFYDLNLGSVDVTYPVRPTLIFPDANSFRDGQEVAITSEYTLLSGWKMDTHPFTWQFLLSGSLDLSFGVSGKICFFGCTDTFTIIPDPYFSTGDFGILSIGTDPYFDTPTEDFIFDFDLLPHTFGDLETAATGLSGTIGLPKVETTSVLAGDDIKASGSHKFIDVHFDLDNFPVSRVGCPVPLGVEIGYGDHFQIEYETIGFTYNGDVTQEQTFTLDPDLKAAITFAEAVQYRIVGKGVSPKGSGTAKTITFDVGNTLYVIYPTGLKEEMWLEPTFSLPNTFSHDGKHLTHQDITMTILKLTLKIPGAELVPELCTPAFCTPAVKVAGRTIIPEICVPEICTPKVTWPGVDIGPLGPLYEDDLWSLDYSYNFFPPPLISGSWELGGFPTLKKGGFALDPENPIIKVKKQVSSVRNNGGGWRTITYVVDVWNAGDVPLSGVQMNDYLEGAFQEAYDYEVNRVYSCGLSVNQGFDGDTSTNLLAGTDTLEVGQLERVIYEVAVEPQPDPLPYWNQSEAEGRSPIGTHVTASDNASVYLGPVEVEDVYDFVLYANDFVKIDQIKDSSGVIGSNRKIEIKNGKSGVLAGDLHGGEFIKVQGDMTIDYAFSGGVIDVVGKSELTVTGSIKEYQSVPWYELPAPSFIPTGPILGEIVVLPGESMVLSEEEGYYETIVVEEGGALDLNEGTYYMERLELSRGATVKMLGPVTLFVGHKIKVDEDVKILSPDSTLDSTRESVINVMENGAITIGKNSEIHGIIIAPAAGVIFDNGSYLEGACYADAITLQPGVRVEYHYECDLEIVDKDCDGVPECL